MSTPGVLGIDPSLTATGLARPLGGTYTIRTKAADGDRRLAEIYKVTISATTFATLAVIEGYVEGGPSAARSGLVQGVVRLAMMDVSLPYVVVPPSTLKKFATGSGAATKPDMRMALYQRAGLDVRDDNQVDAWWLRAIGLELLGRPEIQLPKANRDALAKLALPLTKELLA